MSVPGPLLGLVRLEDRVTPAVTATFNGVSGLLTNTGNAADDFVDVYRTGGKWVVEDGAGKAFNANVTVRSISF